MSAYYDLALKRWEYLNNIKCVNFNNGKAIECQHICELLFKSVIQDAGRDVSLLYAHNLHKLYLSISDLIHLSRDSRLYLGTLSSFYKNAAYPGVDYVEVTDEDLAISLDTTVECLKVVARYHAAIDRVV